MEQTSKTINFMRLILALLVVFLHIKTVSGSGVAYYVLSSFEVVCQLAVPCFFLISGYLFYKGFEEKWDWTLYLNKMKKRVRSLIIPYLIWNVLVALYFIFPMFVGQHREGFGGIPAWLSAHGGGLNFLWADPIYFGAPIDPPLWFMRNLIVITVLSPVLYFLVKRLTFWFIGGGILLYIFFPSYQGVFSTVIFFSIGLFYRLRKYDLVFIASRVSKISIIPAIVLWIMIVVITPMSINVAKMMTACLAIFGVMPIVIFCSKMVSRMQLSISPFLVRFTVFLYAFHFPLNYMSPFRYFRDFLFQWDSVHPIIEILSFFTVYLLIIGISYGLYWVMSRLLPISTSVLCGGR